jgi:lysophospholipase L1-like esterase
VAALSAEAAKPSCTAPPEVLALKAPLPRLRLKLQHRQPATVVAIGSSSTSGFGASSPSHAYPAQLQAELLRRFPGAKLTVHNKGIGGETTAEMLARFDRDVLALEPDLVIWQVGTNAVLRGLDPAVAEGLVREGVARLRAADLDVILMDLQYAPRVLERPDHRAMERRIAATGEAARVSVFHRFEIMRDWIEREHVEPRRVLSDDGLHLNDFSYGCIARLLAASIADRVRAPAPEMVTSRR